jgi:hypothetical protein
MTAHRAPGYRGVSDMPGGIDAVELLDVEDIGPRQAAKRKRSFTLADIARARGTDKVAALRWCRRHAKSHMRMVKGVWTLRADVFLRLTRANVIENLLSRIDVLEESHALLTRRVDAIAARAR